ncbi:hypothetical protein [Nonomuraea lactucae]|uniref:hypothetical protein n=1 Tax=Nonomuraea lactucae TaxID=2249762 RepID=UPI001F06586F|nr:hypothetical protein [Nonomuraea lactucae]
MTEAKALEQREQVHRLDSAFGGMRLLDGIELNIDLTRRHDQAARPNLRDLYVNIIDHPTTRLIGKGEPGDADWPEVFEACARTGTALEINALPDRLDLSADLVRIAQRAGVVFAIDTDAHAVRTWPTSDTASAPRNAAGSRPSR